MDALWIPATNGGYLSSDIHDRKMGSTLGDGGDDGGSLGIVWSRCRRNVESQISHSVCPSVRRVLACPCVRRQAPSTGSLPGALDKNSQIRDDVHGPSILPESRRVGNGPISVARRLRSIEWSQCSLDITYRLEKVTEIDSGLHIQGKKTTEQFRRTAIVTSRLASPQRCIGSLIIRA